MHRPPLPSLPARTTPFDGGASDEGAAVASVTHGGARSHLKWIAGASLCFLGGIAFDRHLLADKPDRSRRILSSSTRLKEPGEWSTADKEGGGAPKESAPEKAAPKNSKVDDKPVEKIILLGERHSGTNWITDYLDDCFGDEVQVSNEYTRYKHWFQEEDLQKVPENSAVVVAMFRDPYDWVEAMRVEPHHAHDHLHWNEPRDPGVYWHRLARPMKWKGFVTRPWIGRRGPHDKNISQSGAIADAQCIDHYSFVDVAPCSHEDTRLQQGLAEYKYEFQHDGSERGFASVVDLRRAKILNHLSVADFRGTRAFFSFRFEDLNMNGTASLLESVEGATGLTAKCNVTMGKAHRRRLGEKKIIKHRELPEDFIEWMNRFVDWEVEGRIGYVRRSE